MRLIILAFLLASALVARGQYNTDAFTATTNEVNDGMNQTKPLTPYNFANSKYPALIAAGGGVPANGTISNAQASVTSTTATNLNTTTIGVASFGAGTSLAISNCPDQQWNLLYIFDAHDSTANTLVWSNTRPDGYKAFLVTNDTALASGFGSSCWSLSSNYPDSSFVLKYYTAPNSLYTIQPGAPGTFVWNDFQDTVYATFSVLALTNSTVVTNEFSTSVYTRFLNTQNGDPVAQLYNKDANGNLMPFAILTDNSPNHQGIIFGQESQLLGGGSVEDDAATFWGTRDPRVTFGLAIPNLGIEGTHEGFIQVKNLEWTNATSIGIPGWFSPSNAPVRFGLGMDGLNFGVELVGSRYPSASDQSAIPLFIGGGHVNLGNPYNGGEMSQLASSNDLSASNWFFGGTFTGNGSGLTNLAGSMPTGTTTNVYAVVGGNLSTVLVPLANLGGGGSSAQSTNLVALTVGGFTVTNNAAVSNVLTASNIVAGSITATNYMVTGATIPILSTAISNAVWKSPNQDGILLATTWSFQGQSWSLLNSNSILGNRWIPFGYGQQAANSTMGTNTVFIPVYANSCLSESNWGNGVTFFVITNTWIPAP